MSNPQARVFLDAAADMRRPSTRPDTQPDPNGNRAQRRAWKRKHRETDQPLETHRG